MRMARFSTFFTCFCATLAMAVIVFRALFCAHAADLFADEQKFMRHFRISF
jgi:hypothetical protein